MVSTFDLIVTFVLLGVAWGNAAVLAWLLFKEIKENKRAVKIAFRSITINGMTVTGNITMANILGNVQEVDLAIQPLDARDKPAQVDGIPVWAINDPSKGTLTPSEDGLSCNLKALDNGTVTITVTADADLGEGVEPIVGTIEVEIVSGKAVKVNIIFGTPRDQVL